MLEKVYWYIFIFFAVLAHVIVGTFLEEDIRELSKALVRNKRVINRSPSGEQFMNSRDRPYVVNIKLNRRLHCIGSILSQRTVITAAQCVSFDLHLYVVTSSSTFTYRGQDHNVIDKKVRGRNRGGSSVVDGVALMTVFPPFVYNFSTANIELHTELLLAGMDAVVSGWGGYVHGGRIETSQPRRLRSITVPIMGHGECVNFYRRIFEIRDEYICTYHELKQCAYTDTGAPLVVNSKLVGVFLGEFESVEQDCPTKPDVYALLQHSEYNQWIRTNIVH